MRVTRHPCTAKRYLRTGRTERKEARARAVLVNHKIRPQRKESVPPTHHLLQPTIITLKHIRMRLDFGDAWASLNYATPISRSRMTQGGQFGCRIRLVLSCTGSCSSRGTTSLLLWCRCRGVAVEPNMGDGGWMVSWMEGGNFAAVVISEGAALVSA